MLRPNHFLLQTAALGVLAASFSGCGGAYDAKLRGIVTLDGKTVPRGTVSFAPVSGGPIAYSPIQSDGSYSIQTGRETGLPAGDYIATVAANELPTVETPPGVPPPDGKPITPLWYASKESSGLKFTVKPGKNEINLELTSQPPAGWKARTQRQI